MFWPISVYSVFDGAMHNFLLKNKKTEVVVCGDVTCQPVRVDAFVETQANQLHGTDD